MLEIEINLNNDTINLYNSKRKLIVSYENLKEPYKILQILEEIFNRIEIQVSMDVMITKIDEDIVKTIGEW